MDRRLEERGGGGRSGRQRGRGEGRRRERQGEAYSIHRLAARHHHTELCCTARTLQNRLDGDGDDDNDGISILRHALGRPRFCTSDVGNRTPPRHFAASPRPPAACNHQTVQPFAIKTTMTDSAEVGKAVPKEQRQGWGQVRVRYQMGEGGRGPLKTEGGASQATTLRYERHDGGSGRKDF